MKHTSCLIILFLLACLVCSAKDGYRFRTMSPPGGFYYDGVMAIEQDYDGFIWIVMEDELFRFDGYQYKKYYPYFAAIDHTKRWKFRDMACNSRGDFYINTNHGLFLYDKNSDNFSKIYGNALFLEFDKADNLWIRNSSGWFILDIQTGEVTTPLYNEKDKPSGNIILCTHNKDMYSIIRNKIYRFNYVNSEFSLCLSLPGEDFNINAAKAHQGKLWIYAGKHGLYKIDLSTFRVETHFDFNIDSQHSLRAFFVDKNGYIWIGTDNGLYIFDPETTTSSHYIHSKKDPFSLPNNSIWTINEDRQQNIWIGTYSGLICYVNIDENNAFETYSSQNSTLSDCPVSALAEDHQYLWIGTEGGGINRINKETGSIEFITTKNNLNSNKIKSFVTDDHNNVWVAMFMGGLNRIRYNRQHIVVDKSYMAKPGNQNSLLVSNIRKILPEGDAGLWIAYQYKEAQISFLSLKDDTFTHINLNDEKNEEDNEYIFDILKQNEKNLWALTNKNLYKMDISTRSTEKIALGDSIHTSLYTLCMDALGYMWIGTIGNGVIRFDPNTYQHISLNSMIPNSIYSVYNICYDDGHIWVGTDNGLYSYDIAQNSLLKFDQGEGTQGPVYYPLATMKGKDGKLYFGGTNGFSIVDPKKISHNRHKPRAIISDFMIDHIPTKFTDVLSSDRERKITLNHNQTNFGFKFSSDNYLIPEKNRFRYRLKGYDNRWIETGSDNRTALYTKIPPGTYSFEIYTANNDGIWGDTPTIIKINRKPAPWLSKPAYLAYFIITISLFLFILHYYSVKKKLEMQLYLENVEKEKKEEIHQSQLRFFTNISHDFRTPLSLIIASLEKLRQEGLKEYYYRILNSNARRLLNLVNELMDFRTIENGKMKLELQYMNINEFVQELGEDFIDYAKQRNIHYSIICDPELSEPLYVDKNIVEKIIMNLLNNAFKYTKDQGYISLETHATPVKSTHKNTFTIKSETALRQVFFITIRDSGAGIPEASLPSVFERFYKSNSAGSDANPSSGIGLALVKSLVLLHRGIIRVCSEENKGTDIFVCLSADKDTYEEEHFLKVSGNHTPTVAPIHEEAVEPISPPEDKITQIRSRNKKKILIAEDNDDLRHLIADHLSGEYEIIQAKDGLEASGLLLQKTPDLIISDIMMPRKDGITLSQEVKMNIETSHIPLVLLTAKTSLESKLEGADSGADIYLEKPIDLRLLLLSVKNIFAQQQKLKDHYSKNYWADTAELCSNEKDVGFLKQFTDMVEENIQNPELDVNFIASGLSMSRSKLYSKIKTLTGKSIIEFILHCRLRIAARLLVEQTLSVQQIMDKVGIESSSYFSRAFKKEFGCSPSEFLSKNKNTH